MTFQQALSAAVRSLKAAGVDGAETDARWLLSAATRVPRGRLTLHLGDALDEFDGITFFQMVDERQRHRPVSKITGEREFFGRVFAVTEDVLDPRPETECLLELALADRFAEVLDLGTGSGVILLSLLAERIAATGVGTDISPQALNVAARNAKKMGVDDRIWLTESDWFSAIDGRYDLIVCNPPYIAECEVAALSPEVQLFDPKVALTDGGDGLGAYRAIVAELAEHLKPAGRVLLEIGPTQAHAVTGLLSAAGLGDIMVHPDLDGRDRVVSAKTQG